MKKRNSFKFYLLELCGIISLITILLPWISYGIGSKTGLDIGRGTVHVILVSGFSFLIFCYLTYKVTKLNKFSFYITLFSSLIMFSTFLFEIIRVAYQTSITKNLPAEMFGVASLATAKIHIGYGLLIGGITSFVPCFLNLIVLKYFNASQIPVKKRNSQNLPNHMN